MTRVTDDRTERLAKALRANLARRKAQARGAAAADGESDDQRAKAKEPSDVATPAA